MQFTKLRLQGFKSFVDPTELVIARGLTGVVGPNGCGKSNLLEALRWVMGETRPSAMRGGGMEDVIFAGAATRPPRSYAEVALHLDNAERLAPVGFNDADRLEIVRRITRDAGSAYRTNGREARARDVQMLFADASTGAHSPSLVRQGQIAELINAKPKARRRVLEEAAGISGLYQRRHEAELKLRGTEANLARVDDLLDGLRAQLASLDRQARQAARYREISEALRHVEALAAYVAWKDAAAAHRAAAAAAGETVQAASAAERGAREAAKGREAAADALPPLREEDAIAAAVLQRQLVARDALDQRVAQAEEEIRAQSGRLAQLRSDAEREEALLRDAGERIGALDWEAKAIARASEGQDGALSAAEEAAQTAASVLRTEEAALDRLVEDTARLAARHQSAERRVREAADQVARADRDVAEAEEAIARLTAEHQAAATARTDADRALAEAEAEAARADAALGEAEAARSGAQSAEADRREIRAGAEGRSAALAAEVDALRGILAEGTGDRARLLDALQVEPGFEAALAAALGEDLDAPEATGPEISGWAGADGAGDPALPDSAAPLAARVTAPGVLDRRLAQVGIVDAAQGPALRLTLSPGQRLVSRDGDLWRWDGFVRRASDTPSAAARRLQQANRLRALEAALAESAQAAEAAVADHDKAQATLDAARSAEAAARTARIDADDRVAKAVRQAAQAETSETALTARLDAARQSRAARQQDGTTARAAHEAAAADQAGLEDLDTARATLEARRTDVDGARADMLAARQALDDLRRDVEARARRAHAVARELESWRGRQGNADSRAAELAARTTEAEAALTAAQARPDALAEERNALVGLIEAAEGRSRAAGDALAAAEAALREAEGAERQAEAAASDAREARARAETLAETAAERMTAAAAQIAEDYEETPETLLGTLDADPERLPEGESLATEAARLTRQRDALGAVNLRAEADRAAVAEEYEALAAEKTDLDAAVAKLRHGIAGLNHEGRTRLLQAFDEVNRNFAALFKTLFGGGEAELVLVESDDPLEAGLEIMCQPPGKKLSTLSLLSGGEQTLTALSLIFAVFLANPSPICVLDEVDAPLDDANVTRFCDLLDEMIRRTDTRFLIITHHAVTMSRMDRLYGVTMVEQGVSQLVSVDLSAAEQMAEA